MRTILFIISAFALFSSCRSDDSNTKNDKNLLIGTWQNTRMQVVDAKNLNSVLVDYTSNHCDLQSTYEYTASKRKTVIYSKANNSNNCILEVNSEYNYTYDTNNNKIVLQHGGYADVLKISNDELVYRTNSEEDRNNDGVNDLFVYYFVRN